MSSNLNSFNSHPNFGSNSSRAMPNFGYNFQNDGQCFDFNYSNLGQNHVNYGQNGLVSHTSNQPTLGFGQLGLSQRVSDVIRRNNNFSSPQRVHVQSIIDYFPVQNQPGLGEVTVTEIVKTKFLTSNSARDMLILTPNDHMISSSQQPIFPNLNLLMPNQSPSQSHESIFDSSSFLQNWSQHQSFNVPNPLTTQNDEQPFHNSTSQNFTQNQSISPSATMSSQVNNNNYFTESVPAQNICNQNQPINYKPNITYPSVTKSSDGEILDPEPLNVFVSKTLQDLDQNQNPSDLSDVDKDDDGRTHSLSRKKYGPYTCPKCKQEFITSQSFAAHVVSAHYKYETAAERKKRLDAKYKKRNLRVAQSSINGLTIVPDDQSFNNINADWRKKAKSVPVKIEGHDDHQVKKQGEVRVSVWNFLCGRGRLSRIMWTPILMEDCMLVFWLVLVLVFLFVICFLSLS